MVARRALCPRRRGLRDRGGSVLVRHAPGKFLTWSTLLEGVALGDGDRALDLGCGHGAVAIDIARRIRGAVVDGIDLWRSIDQSGNSPEAFLRNADLNGVRDRITVTTGNMTRLPYEDGVFMLVTASLAIHNIPTAAGRREAVAEAWRVLRPGGTLLIVDIRRTSEYAATLRGPRRQRHAAGLAGVANVVVGALDENQISLRRQTPPIADGSTNS